MQQAHDGEEVYHGQFLNVRVKTLPQPKGGTRHYEIVEHPDAVAIVGLRYAPTDPSHAHPLVALVRQERPVLGKATWEIPAGLIEPHEQSMPQHAAAREFLEETGYTADTWQILVRQYPSPGFSTEAVTIYLAKQTHPATPEPAEPKPVDPTEIDQVRWIPLDEALALCEKGEINDGKTILGLHLARLALNSATPSEGEAHMPRDPTNMPFARSSAQSDGSVIAAVNGLEGKFDSTLKAESMLLEEFNYASVTAYQAMEDRARMFNLYLLLVGVFASGLGALYQLGGNLRAYSQQLAILLLLFAAALGVVFFLKLIRLRQAYRESLIAMNVIKEFYIHQFKQDMPHLERAFRWRLKGIPAGERFGSVTFLVCSTTASLGSLGFAGAAFLAVQLWLGSQQVGGPSIAAYIVASVVLGIALLAHTLYYRHALNRHDEQKILQKEAREIGISLSESRK
jgi:8-oxo-dGTP pyrophosphatase MutT (NUDIX family)